MSHSAIIVLAAGEGSRMQQIKQLLPYKSTTLLEHALTTALSTQANHTLCVLGAHSPKILEHGLPNIVIPIENIHWKEGMGSSIAAALQYLNDELPTVNTVLFTLADQPLVTTAYLNLILKTSKERPTSIIATNYETSLGVPALFPKRYFEILKSLQGETGAKSILMAHQSQVIALTPNFENLDVDTPEAYQKILKL
ncbi:nucleotidyltransferase family protein [Mangrovimonas sp. YM274]|uniref:nucleotidyltransferase family protein n=1 Tax=Mangrovimonas sp. YM274 TaxID=3070660 RepID=UPI0027DAC660|nr:nucleotidyltransferase family protein [Mangrovimonas sp. YM274]WMI68801.1 nucleotidyltransferase family protein [Mangrovimonas sp. YM274]